MKRTLSLTRETLTALADAELGAVAGGAAQTTPLTDCLSPYTRDSYVVCTSGGQCATHSGTCGC